MEKIATSGTVTYANRLSQLHANFYNLLNNTSNIPDVKEGNTKRKFVYTREPVPNINFSGFPLVIIRHPSEVTSKYTADKTKKLCTWIILISVYSSDYDTNRQGMGNSDNDTLTTSILNTLENQNNIYNLIDCKVGDYDIDASEPYEEMFNDKPIIRREITLTITGLLKVVA